MRFIALLLALALTSCGGSQKAAQTPAPAPTPAWVSSKPVSNGYYNGIGMARKDMPGDYLQSAKNNALNDLSSEISVEIKSNSMFNQIEAGDQYKSNYQNTTKLKSREALEDFELAGTWEDATTYWVYYRLNKGVHAANKERRKQQATERALNLYQSANQLSANGQGLEAVQQRFKAMETLSPYLDEAILVEIEGVSKDLSLEVYRSLTNDLRSFSLDAPDRVIQATRGNPTEDLVFTALYHGKTVAGLPVRFQYSEGRISGSKTTTNAQGRATYNLGKITARGPDATFKASLDLETLLETYTTDENLRLMLGRTVTTEATLSIYIVSPKIYISSQEKAFGKSYNNRNLSRALEQAFSKDGYQVVRSERGADFIVSVSADTREGPNSNGFFTTYLNGMIEVKNAKGQLLHTEALREVRGVQSSYELSADDAYARGADDISRALYLSIRRKLFE